MTTHLQRISVQYDFPVIFTRNLFSSANRALLQAIIRNESKKRHRCLVMLDWGVHHAFPDLTERIQRWFAAHTKRLDLVRAPMILAGGESVKRSARPLERMIEALRTGGICRHSCCIAIGGGAFLDAAGLAAALFHRGVRMVRIPTTALAQCDSGVGVKNAVNHADSKNLLGTFAPPWAVLNDSSFLDPLSMPLLLDGIAEAVKVSAIKDAVFFRSIERAAPRIRNRNMSVIRRILKQSALLHMEHIATSGDPFELGTARPLDYGHWAAHKLESLSGHRISHGHAVAIGISLDALYAACIGLLPEQEALRLIRTLQTCGLPTYSPLLARANRNGVLPIFNGLEEFRAHLGGDLTLTMPAPLGSKQEIHSVDLALMHDCIMALAELQ